MIWRTVWGAVIGGALLMLLVFTTLPAAALELPFEQPVGSGSLIAFQAEKPPADPGPIPPRPHPRPRPRPSETPSPTASPTPTEPPASEVPLPPPPPPPPRVPPPVAPVAPPVVEPPPILDLLPVYEPIPAPVAPVAPPVVEPVAGSLHAPVTRTDGMRAPWLFACALALSAAGGAALAEDRRRRAAAAALAGFAGRVGLAGRARASDVLGGARSGLRASLPSRRAT